MRAHFKKIHVFTVLGDVATAASAWLPPRWAYSLRCRCASSPTASMWCCRVRSSRDCRSRSGFSCKHRLTSRQEMVLPLLHCRARPRPLLGDASSLAPPLSWVAPGRVARSVCRDARREQLHSLRCVGKLRGWATSHVNVTIFSCARATSGGSGAYQMVAVVHGATVHGDEHSELP